MILRICFIILLVAIQSLSVVAGTIDFSNDREGLSLYATKSNNKKINSTLKKVNAQVILDSFKNALATQNQRNLCAFSLNESFINALGVKKPSKSLYQGALFYLRSQELVDDVVTQILLNAYNVANKIIYTQNSDYPSRLLPGTFSQRNEIYQLLRDFPQKYLSRHCYDEAYRLLHSDMLKVMPLSQHSLKNLLLEAQERRFINDDVYKLLERARLSELHLKSVNLKDYYTKIQNLRIQYPLPLENERSDFVTKINGINLTHRQQLLAQYNDLQIILMGNLIKKLRARLESDRIEIWVYDQDGEVEVIPLAPMERFRFSLKILRKEMHELALNTQFKGRAPNYMDLIAASFELGLIAGTELDELGGLEDIWNPQKTFWEKASFWVRSFSSVATILIPPPYGFVPILALIAIEASVDSKEMDIDDGSLF